MPNFVLLFKYSDPALRIRLLQILAISDSGYLANILKKLFPTYIFHAMHFKQKKHFSMGPVTIYIEEKNKVFFSYFYV